MSLSFYLIKRYIFSKKDSRSLSFFSFIAVSGIAIGVSVLIIALSVLKGFEKILTEKLINLDSHIQITGFSNNPLPDYNSTMPEIRHLMEGEYNQIKPYVLNLAIVKNKRINEGITIKGVMPDYFAGLSSYVMVEGNSFLEEAQENKQIIIGRSLSDKLRTKAGDEITLFALKENKIPDANNLPAIEKFVVSGIFQSGLAKYDNAFAYININTAQELFGLKDKINGYEIKINDVSKIDSLANVLQENLRYPHYVRTVYKIYKHIFTWIELQKKPIPIVLGLIIIVAVFNIISTLLMLVLEKMNSIGTLKSMGATRKQIIKIFLYQGVFLGFVGVLAGNLLSYLLLVLQLKFNIITLPAEIYFTSTVPILIEPFTFVLVSVIAFVLSVLSSLLPSYIASRLNPVSTLRFA
ncbi:MAG TPA: ABC transporter permease [Ignavibacteriaceae bacterium]|jgi:lipoprotein-releasing system permease protein|nr:ABC transporter permease [Ignavibacteriaceae bacterium]